MISVLLLAAAQVPFLACVQLVQRLLSGIRRFRAAAAVRCTYALCGAGLGCGALLLGRGEVGALAGLLLGGMVAAILASVLLARGFAGLPGVTYDRLRSRTAYWTRMTLPGAICLALLLTTDLWCVKLLVAPPEAVGYYSVAYSLSRLPFFLLFGLAGAVYPTVSRALASQRPDQARRVTRQALRFVLIAFVPASAVLAGAPAEIIRFLFSADYTPASMSLVILAPSILLAGFMFLGLRLQLASDRPGLRLVILACLFGLAVACNLSFISWIGMVGAAVASLITFAVGAATGVSLIKRRLGTRPPLYTALRCTVAGLILFAAARIWTTSGWILLVKLLLLGLLYISLLALMGECTREDLQRLAAQIVGGPASEPGGVRLPQSRRDDT